MIGIDACPYGWCVVHGTQSEVRIDLIRDLAESKELLGQYPMTLIDIPIGLPDREHPRSVEERARRILSHRSSSIFQTPSRRAVYAGSYEEALAHHRDYTGKGISIQSWHICPKIKEVDIFLKNNVTFVNILKEAHPEFCFHFLQKESIRIPSKKTREGRMVRLKILENWIPNVRETFAKARSNYKKKDVQDDDILDAFCLWAVGLLSQQYGLSTVIEDQEDAVGIPMNMHFVDPFDRFTTESG